MLTRQGGTLFGELDNIQPLERDPLAPFRMSVIDKYKDMGTIVMGKSEAGIVRKGDRLYVMPNKCARPGPAPWLRARLRPLSCLIVLCGALINVEWMRVWSF